MCPLILTVLHFVKIPHHHPWSLFMHSIAPLSSPLSLHLHPPHTVSCFFDTVWPHHTPSCSLNPPANHAKILNVPVLESYAHAMLPHSFIGLMPHCPSILLLINHACPLLIAWHLHDASTPFTYDSDHFIAENMCLPLYMHDMPPHHPTTSATHLNCFAFNWPHTSQHQCLLE